MIRVEKVDSVDNNQKESRVMTKHDEGFDDDQLSTVRNFITRENSE